MIRFHLSDISIYRSELMGIAMIWIMMIHFDFTQIKPLGFISQFGFIGPDIFLFVSGYGLFFSLEKNENLFSYFKKRIFRIFPTYYLIGIIPSIIFYKDSIFDYFFRYTTIGYWTNNIYGDWYIPSAVMLYLWAPIIKRLLDKNSRLLFPSIVIIILLAFYLVDKNAIIDRSHFSFLHRIPSFIFGMTCALWTKNGSPIKYYYLIMFICIPICAYLYPHHHQIYNYKDFSITYLLPSVILVFCFVLKSSCKYLRLNSLFSIIGNASLEIYLIQGIVFHAVITKSIIIPPAWHDTITISFIFGLSILGVFVHWLIDKTGITRIL